MNITVNIPENIISQVNKNAGILHERYAKLQRLSTLVRDESVKVNTEFEGIEHDPQH